MDKTHHESVEIEVEEADLEKLAKEGRHVRHARRYRIRVDDHYYVSTKAHLTGQEILLLAGKQPPEAFILTQKLRGGRLVTIGLDEVVDFTAHGIERFTTLPREVQEG